MTRWRRERPRLPGPHHVHRPGTARRAAAGAPTARTASPSTSQPATPGGGSPRVYGLGAMQAFTPLVDSSRQSRTPTGAPATPARHAQSSTSPRSRRRTPARPSRSGSGTRETPTRSRPRLAGPRSPTAERLDADQLHLHGAHGHDERNCARLQLPDERHHPRLEHRPDQRGAVTNGDIFNGCWLTIRAQIPADYTAEQDGWWRIRYRMDSSGTTPRSTSRPGRSTSSAIPSTWSCPDQRTTGPTPTGDAAGSHRRRRCTPGLSCAIGPS